MNLRNTSLTLLAIVLFAPILHGAVLLTTLHSFTGPDGATPEGGLVLAADGSLYGLTSQDGFTNQFGTVFRISPDGTFTNLYNLNGASDGAWPKLRLALGSDGALYGTTAYRGANFWGTMFRINPSGDFRVLAALDSFSGSAGSPLVPAKDGNFYCIGNFGFGTGLGSLLAATADGVVNYLATFYGTNGFTGWSFDRDILFQGVDGNLYGATEYGGPEFDGEFLNPAYGTVFQATPDGTLKTLFSFNGTNGAYVSALIQGHDGNLYGTTGSGGPAFIDNPTFGGTGGFGTLFKLTTNGEFSTLAIFDSTNGSEPSSLMQASDGNFYGTTQRSSASNARGTIFKMTADGAITTLFFFSGTNGAAPAYSALLEALDGNFYGTTISGGTSNLGTIFRLNTHPAQLTITAAAGNVILTWLTNATGFTLQSTTNLASSAIWSPVPATPVIVDGQNTVTNPISGTQQFYRLINNSAGGQ